MLLISVIHQHKLCAIKLLVACGLDTHSLHTVFNVLVVSKLAYAIPAWWGYSSAEDRDRINSVLRRGKRMNLYRQDGPSIEQLCAARDSQLFKAVLTNSNHVLHHLLPTAKTHQYNTRARVHNRSLPDKSNSICNKNFLTRLLYKDSY